MDVDDIPTKLNTLQHYGVKGMKWGVRKDNTSSTRQTRYDQLRNRPLESMSVKTRDGTTVDVVERKTPAITAFILSVSKKATANQQAYKTFDLKVNGKTVGNASFNWDTPSELNLVWLGVNSKEQGKGYGTAVFDAAVQYGKRNGAQKLTLEVPGNAPNARHIYEKQGFSVGKEVSPDADIWGGLTEMSLDLREKVVVHSQNLSEELEMALNETFPKMPEDLESLEETLSHYGIKGMKWGVRKDRIAGAVAKTAKAVGKAAIDSSPGRSIVYELDRRLAKATRKDTISRFKVAREAMSTAKPELAAFKSSFKQEHPNYRLIPWRRREYNEGYSKIYNNHLKTAAQTLGKDRTNFETFKVHYAYVGGPNKLPKVFLELKNYPTKFRHADGDSVEAMMLELPIIAIDDAFEDIDFDKLSELISQLEVEVSNEEFEDTLAHYGVKGMKWGVRRPTGPDGIVKKSGSSVKDLGDKVAGVAKSSYEGTRPLARKAKTLTEDELRVAVRRLELEKRYVDLTVDMNTRQKTNFQKILQKSVKDESNRAMNDPKLRNAIEEAIKLALLKG